MPQKQVIEYDDLLPHGPNVPHAVRVGDLIEFSAVRPQRPDGSVGESFQEQAHDALDNLRQMLVREGLTHKHVVKVVVFCTDAAAVPALNDEWAKFFPKEDRPARVFVGVAFTARRGTYFTFDVTARADIEA